MLNWGKSNKPQAEPAPAAGAAAESVRLAPAAPAAAPPPAFSMSLPELLLSEGQVTRAQVEQAMAKQQATGAFLGEVLIEQGAIDEKSLLSFLTKHCKIPHLSLLDYLIDREILSVLPKEVCLKYRVLPIDKLGKNLTVAMVNPLDVEALEAVRRLCPDLRIKPILCAYKHFDVVTARLFRDANTEQHELTATALGLKMPLPSAAPAAAPVHAPVAEEPLPEPEEVPDAVEVVEEPLAALAPAPEPTEQDKLNDSFLGEIFRSDSDAPAEKPAESPMESSSIMKEMASVMMDSMRDTYAMLARRMELFRGLDPQDVARIFSRGASVEFEEGAIIFEKGQKGDTMYVLLGGEVGIFDGDRELARLERGDMFGEMGLISRLERSATARALTFCSCLTLNHEIIHNVMPRDVSVQLLENIVVTLSERLREANMRHCD